MQEVEQRREQLPSRAFNAVHAPQFVLKPNRDKLYRQALNENTVQLIERVTLTTSRTTAFMQYPG